MSFPPKHKAKILVFSPWYPPHIGGLENHAEQFNDELTRRGYQILVVTPLSDAGGSGEEIVSDSLTILRFPAYELVPKYPLPACWRRRWWKVWRQARSFGPDIIISRTRFFSTTALAYWYHHRSHRPWLHIEHGSHYVQFDNWWLRQVAFWYDQSVSRWLLHRAQALVANSAASRKFTIRLSGRSDVSVIYRGVRHERLAAVPAAPRPIELANQGLIVYTGRLIAGKGLPVLLEALASLPGQRIHCYIIGSGPQAKKLHTLARRLGLSRQLTFFSHLAWDEAMGYLKSADMCVNPSYSEGLPTSLIEAALCGVAIVATDVGGTAEIITDQKSGLLVPAGQPGALAQALQKLTADPLLRRRLADEAQAIVTQKFKWAASIDRYEKLFAKLQQL